ncbi:sugar phosphate isomerase/epimerase [Candidatus Poribacteria bacterium]|nr:sugar phosphate isomerase/epimerase [Candidatus Poribacteria bacterium]MYI93588.1 sugar phosphate isomerase/epimerase [Candidatus Poribacteria bacterium]
MIGISYHAGGMKDLSLQEVITILSDIGYDAIEMMCGPEAHISSGEVTEKLLKNVKEIVTDHGLKVSVINPFTGKGLYQLALEDMQSAVDHYALLQDVAVALEAKGVNFLTGYGGDKGDAFAWKLLVDVLKPICQRAEKFGLTMNIHNHEATTIDTSSKVLLLIEHVGSDSLRVLNDITNFYHMGEDIAEVTERLGHLTTHCHVKGVSGMYPYSTFLIPGEDDDELDFKTFAESLGKVRYDKYISVETFPHMHKGKAQIAYDMMSQVLNALELR